MISEIVVRLSSNTRYWQMDCAEVSGKRRKRSLGPKSQFSRRQAQKHCRGLPLGRFLRSYLESLTELKKATKYL
jgi:hypothetical protein